MSVTSPHRFTVEEYYRMAETGLLAPDARVELLEGQIIDMSPIGPLHGGVVERLTKWLVLQAKERFAVRVQSPVRLHDHSEPEPDVVLARQDEHDYTQRHPGPDDVFLIIEVAQSSLDYDREQKLPIYARAGIPEVWIVNLEDTEVEVHREPNYLGYSSRTILRIGDTATTNAFHDVKLDITALLR